MTIPFDAARHLKKDSSEVAQFEGILQRLHQKIRHDQVVQTTADGVRNSLRVDRVVLYYFYREWEGQVTFESLSDEKYSIFGSTGPDQCFNGEYAQLYLEGRASAIADIETADIAPCHRDFLRHISVRANLVVPILINKNSETTLWGLLVAHHCQSERAWPAADIEQMRAGAVTLATAAAIKTSV
ncbi:MAG: GAF domain-containing protein [Phormidesmis sp.]